MRKIGVDYAYIRSNEQNIVERERTVCDSDIVKLFAHIAVGIQFLQDVENVLEEMFSVVDACGVTVKESVDEGVDYSWVMGDGVTSLDLGTDVAKEVEDDPMVVLLFGFVTAVWRVGDIPIGEIISSQELHDRVVALGHGGE